MLDLHIAPLYPGLEVDSSCESNPRLSYPTTLSEFVMPTPSECEAFWNERLAKGYKFDHGKSVREKWPTRDEQLEYYRWSKKRANEESAEFLYTPTSREDFKEMVAKMNYNSTTDRGKLVSAVERVVVPWLPVGERNGKAYRIFPGVYGLQSDQSMPKTNRELISANVLGVNTNVQPSKPARTRKGNLSEMSTRSNESDDPGTGGFVFHQIGTLEVWGDERHNLQSFEDAGRGPWLPTGFCVVMRFTKSGTANGLYLIYDFYPQDDLDNREKRTEDNNWGCLPGDGTNEQFSLARFADQITELRFGRTFCLTEVLDYPIELVRAVKTPDDTIIRATVAE